MSTSRPKSKTPAKESGLYDGVIEEFLAWIEVDHEDWHRRMDKLHKDLEKAHQTSSGAIRGQTR
jgi:hypothetical protein